MADTTEGTQPAPTGANAEGTQPAPTGANAEDRLFTEAELGYAKRQVEKKAAREIEKAKAAWERERLDELEADSFDDVKERLTLKKQEEGEGAKAALEAKKLQRETAAKIKQLEAFKAEADVRLAKHRKGALKAAIFEAAQKFKANERAIFGILVAEHGAEIDDDGNVFTRGADGEQSDVSLEKLIQQIVADDAGLLRPTGAAGSGSLPQHTGARASGGNDARPSDKIRAGVADLVTQTYGQMTRR